MDKWASIFEKWEAPDVQHRDADLAINPFVYIAQCLCTPWRVGFNRVVSFLILYSLWLFICCLWIDCCVSRTPAGVRSVQAQVLFDATDGELAALAGAVDVSDGVDKAIGTRFRACVADYVGPDRTAWGGYYQRLQQCRGLTIVGARGRTISCVNRNPDLDLLSAPGAVFGAEYRLYDASREAVEAAASDPESGVDLDLPEAQEMDLLIRKRP